MSSLVHDTYVNLDTPWTYACDRQWAPRISQMARALDLHAGLIKKYQSDPTEEASDGKIIQIGPYSFLQTKQVAGVRDQWVTEKYGWQGLWDLFQKIQSKSKDPQWSDLDLQARNLISEDRKRIIFFRHPHLGRRQLAKVGPLARAFEKCRQDELCTRPQLSEAQIHWLTEGPYYKTGWDVINRKDVDDGLKRGWVLGLTERLNSVAEDVEFSVNPQVRTIGKTLHVPMKLDMLGDGKNLFKNLVQQAWSQFGLNVVIDTALENEIAFQVFVGRLAGYRPYVERSTFRMQLSNYDDTGSLTHEFGHVMGLRDAYFTTFDLQKCQYQDEYNQADIMSVQDTGRVLPNHIEKIREAYFVSDE